MCILARAPRNQSSGQLEGTGDQAPGDRLPQKTCQMKRKFIFVQILIERGTSGSWTTEEHEFHNQVLNRRCAICGIYPSNLQNFQLIVASWNQSLSDCPRFHLGLQRITETSEGSVLDAGHFDLGQSVFVRLRPLANSGQFDSGEFHLGQFLVAQKKSTTLANFDQGHKFDWQTLKPKTQTPKT